MSLLETQPQNYIEMKSITWSKDSHGLFDYENTTNYTTKFQIKGSSSIYRLGNEISLANNRKNGDKSTPLTEITCATDENNNKNFILKPSAPGNQDEVFFIVRTFKHPDNQPKGYVINPGDLIKLGRNEYQILECKYENQQVITHNLNTFCEPIQYQYPQKSSDPLQKKTCKICFSDEIVNDDDNLFISPCKCKGSCEFVHIGCLRVWLNSRLAPKSQGNTLYYHWKKLECEVCKEPMPKVIEYGEKKINLFTIARPELPYILMENVYREKKTSKGMYLVQMLPNDQIKLGRGHQCDLRVSDISVSRLHAMIKYERDKFVIYDNNSKFGTLVLMKEPFAITNEKLGIQIGRTVISLSPRSSDLQKCIMANSISKSANTIKGINKTNSLENYDKKPKSREKGKEPPTMMKLEPKNEKEDDDILDFGRQQNMDEEMNPEDNEK